MRKNILIVLLMAMLLVCLTGCSNTASEKRIQSDLESNTQFDFLGEGEKIEKLVIEKRQTDKKQKVDTIWCTVITADTEISCQKEVVLTYGLYDKDGWMLDDVSVNKSSEWVKEPLAGISEENIKASLDGHSVTANGEDWSITKDTIKSISIDNNNTNLEEKVDEVMVSLTLDADVEEASGQLIINYKFDDGWKVDTLSGEKEFTTTVKPDKALDATNEDLIGEIVKQEILYGASEYDMGNGFSMVNTASQQTITIDKGEISNFIIENQESSSKGSYQKYDCSCTVTKSHAIFNLKIKILYSYDGSNGWGVQQIEAEPEVISVNLEGDWKGDYTVISGRGEVVLSLDAMADDGTISGTYSYTPEVIDISRQPGSYYVSGTIDKDTLLLNLKAGEWIKKPEKPFHTDIFEKTDIRAILYINDSKMEGSGHRSGYFTITQ